MSDSMDAQVQSWELSLVGLKTPVGLELAAVRLWGEGVGIQSQPFAYQMDEPADLEALIHEANLEAFVRTKVPENIEAISLKLETGRVLVRATVRVLIPVTATAQCSLRIEDGRRVLVVLDSVEVLGAGVKSLVQKQIDAINPVLDVSDWPFDVFLDEIRIEDARLVAVGRIRPPELSKPR